MFDRMIFKGHLLRLYHPGGVQAFLWNLGVPLTRFGEWAKATTEALCVHAQRAAAEAGRPCIYLDHAVTRDTGQTKEDLARQIAERDGITEGLVCILRAVEPCRSFTLRRNHATHKLDVVSSDRKCVHVYWYFIDPEFGFCHIRLQTWLPFGIQVYVNGREWLARQLDARDVGYIRAGNALLRIDDLDVAADLCERFAHRAWPRFLDALAQRVNIHLPAIAAAEFRSYYWCLDQAEIATDVMFADRRSLTAVLPDIVRHASLNMSSTDVLRFLGRKLHPPCGPKSPPTPGADPRGGESSTVSLATRSRSTTRSRSFGSRPPSITRVSSGCCASSPTSTAGASGGGARWAKEWPTCGATTRWGSAPTVATWTPWPPPP
jgi:hypothetical protein